VTRDEATQKAAAYWMRKAEAALQSARSECDAGRYDFSINRSYYAAFYAASAVLLLLGKRFVKHSGLRGAMHRDLVKPGLLDMNDGKAYDRLFEARQQADYLELVSFGAEEARSSLSDAIRLVDELQRLIGRTHGV
jgi:uncharacterized protein